MAATDHPGCTAFSNRKSNIKELKLNNVTVTERALVRRINRKLSRGYYSLGRFHVVDVYSNTVLDWRFNLAERARELGVLGANEQLEG